MPGHILPDGDASMDTAGNSTGFTVIVTEDVAVTGSAQVAFDTNIQLTTSLFARLLLEYVVPVFVLTPFSFH